MKPMFSKMLAGLSALTVVSAGLATLPTTSVAYASSSVSLSTEQTGALQRIVDKYPDAFAGLWADSSTRFVTIKVPARATSQSDLSTGLQAVRLVGSASDPDLHTGPKLWRGIQFITGGPSMATLNALLSKVTRAEPWASAAQDSIDAYYADPRLGKVVIEVDVVTPALVSAALATFGDMVQLRVGSRGHVLNRTLDTQPYFGGDRVSAAGGSCTVSWEVIPYNTSNHGFLTAGHCWGVGTIVYQGYYDSNGVLHKSGTMGKVTKQIYGNGSIDAEYIDATSTGTSINDVIWVTQTTTFITGRFASNYIGEPNCWDGAFTATQNCNGIVQNANTCQVLNGVNTCGLVRDSSANGSNLGQPGDSGGPVEWQDGDGSLIDMGTITGVAGSNWYFTDDAFELGGLGVNLVTH